MVNRKKGTQRKWYAVDLHLHTPASSDYLGKNVSYLDILKQSEKQGLDVIAFTDHNTVAGYRKMMEEVEQLRLLNSLNRILPDEEGRLKEYERIMKKILVLPGFEFTATLGFHILAIFSPEKPVREIEHLLLQLRIPSSQLDDGSVTVGASSDVITAYREINQAGGLVIAAHANSTNGVAMRGFRFGGQTKIAYTQDANLHALEVTDLEVRGRRTTATFFNGTKPEYQRRMHCIQGSDAHLLTAKAGTKKIGIGDRATEMLLSEVSFESILDLLKNHDFARTRPSRRKKGQKEFDFIRSARDEGSNIIQEFHESMTVRGGRLYAVIADVCALANTNGGTLYVGFDNNPKSPIVGVNNVGKAIQQIEKEISNRISPPLSCTVDSHKAAKKDVLRILVPRGEEPPYAVDDNKIYIRSEAETSLAVRDEIVNLVKRTVSSVSIASAEAISLVPKVEEPVIDEKGEPEELAIPRTGVEVVSVVERKGVSYYALRDLRNGNVVKNVTEKSARRLWHYAIKSYAGIPEDINKAKVQWQGDVGILRSYTAGSNQAFDLIERKGKKIRYFFGVTEDGIHTTWRDLVGLGDD